MAKLTGNLAFTGTLGNLSAYRRQDSDKIILRIKHGPSREKILALPSYDILRRNNTEFGGRATASKYIRQLLFPFQHIADHNLQAELGKLCKPLQELDTDNAYGSRSVLLSKQPSLLQGFNLNRRYPFDAVLKGGLSYTVSKESLEAQVTIPALLPGVNFIVPPYFPFYKVVVSLGVVPDLYCAGKRYEPIDGCKECFPSVVYGEWRASSRKAEESAIELSLADIPSTGAFSLLLSVGILFGKHASNGEPEAVKYAGAAKIMAGV